MKKFQKSDQSSQSQIIYLQNDFNEYKQKYEDLQTKMKPKLKEIYIIKVNINQKQIQENNPFFATNLSTTRNHTNCAILIEGKQPHFNDLCKSIVAKVGGLIKADHASNLYKIRQREGCHGQSIQYMVTLTMLS